jgi:hypothetical protein
MTEARFPVDAYTPHGYLANPYSVAHSWSAGEGGCLRSSREHVGFGWQLPWALRAQASVDLVVSLEGDGQRLVTRADFDAAGLHSPHHSANLFVYRWEALGRTWEAAYTLVDRDALGVEVSWVPLPDAAALPDAQVGFVLPGRWDFGDPARSDVAVEPGEWFGRFELLGDHDALGVTTASGAIQAIARRSAGASAPPPTPPPHRNHPVARVRPPARRMRRSGATPLAWRATGRPRGGAGGSTTPRRPGCASTRPAASSRTSGRPG